MHCLSEEGDALQCAHVDVGVVEEEEEEADVAVSVKDSVAMVGITSDMVFCNRIGAKRDSCVCDSGAMCFETI